MPLLPAAADPEVLAAVAERLVPLAAGLAALVAPVAAAGGPGVWRGEAADAFEAGLDGLVRALTTVEGQLQALSCELAMHAAHLRAGD